MRVLVDTAKGNELSMHCVVEVVTINSREIMSLVDDEEEQSVLQAEWLYHLYVDKSIDLVVVEDTKVGLLLMKLDVPVVSFV